MTGTNMQNNFPAGINWPFRCSVNFPTVKVWEKLVFTTQAHASKAYHLGVGKSATKSNLSKANTNSDYLVFEGFAYHVITEVPQMQRNGNIKRICLLFKHIGVYLNGFYSIRRKGSFKVHACVTLKDRYPHFSIALLRGNMTATQWMPFHTRKIRSTSLTKVSTTSGDCTTSAD